MYYNVAVTDRQLSCTVISLLSLGITPIVTLLNQPFESFNLIPFKEILHIIVRLVC